IVAEVAHVAGVEPAIDEAVVCGLLVAEVRVHDALAPAPDLSDLVIALDLPLLSADLDVDAGQRLAAIDDRPVAGRARKIARGSGQPFFLDQLYPNAFARRHHRDRQRGLC